MAKLCFTGEFLNYNVFKILSINLTQKREIFQTDGAATDNAPVPMLALNQGKQTVGQN